MKKSVFFVAFFAGYLFFTVPVQADQATMAEIEALWNDGKKSQANRQLDKWMSKDKNSPWPWVESGILRFKEKKYKRALSALKTALDKSPQCADAYYWRGRSYEAMQKPMDAANEYRAALVVENGHQEAKDALARIQVLLGSPESN